MYTSAYCTTGTGLGLGLMGKLGQAWVGAWVVVMSLCVGGVVLNAPGNGGVGRGGP